MGCATLVFYVDFKIPYLRDYLKEHAVHHQMKKDIAKAQAETLIS